MSMLEFCKKVLRSVSFDRFLFRKELSKAKVRLIGSEQERLKRWSLFRYGQDYQQEILEVFGDH